MEGPESDKVLDVTGLGRPHPIKKAKEALADMESGQVLEVHATDPGARADYSDWTRRMGHTLVEARFQGKTELFFIRKG